MLLFLLFYSKSVVHGFYIYYIGVFFITAVFSKLICYEITCNMKDPGRGIPFPKHIGF